jgi:hypothetical protein
MLVLVTVVLVALMLYTPVKVCSTADSVSAAAPTAKGDAPVFVAEPVDPSYATYGVLLNFTCIVKDVDNDTLTVTWAWGDGSVNVTTTGPAASNTIIRNGHIYTPPIEQGRGEYYYNLTMTIHIDDGNGNNVSCTTTVFVLMPPNGIPSLPSIRVNGTASTTIDPSDIVYVVVKASDPEGEPLTWTYVFTNDTDEVYRMEVLNTPATDPGENVWVNLSHTFGTVGLHRIDVYVSDALIPYQLYPHNHTNAIYAQVVVNTAPLSSAISCEPSTPVIPWDIGYVEVNLRIDVADMEGNVIYATWDFGDGSLGAGNMTAGGSWVYTLVQAHRYVDVGVFNVTVVLTDGRPDHEVEKYELLTITSDNTPPEYVVISYTCHGLFPPFDYVGEEVRFSLTVTDAEQDPIEVTWDFGDGSPLVTENLTEYVYGNVRSSVNHTFLAPGICNITATYTDNQEGIGTHTLHEDIHLLIIVDDIPPRADAGGDEVAFVGDVVYFDGSGSSDNWAIANYTWTFVYNGSEVLLWDACPEFQFWTPGLYLVVLNVTDMVGNYNTSSMYVAIYEEIPEFGSVIPATMAVMILIVVMVARLRKKRC